MLLLKNVKFPGNNFVNFPKVGAYGENDLSVIIEEEKLKVEETHKFIDNSFRDGVLKTTGTDIDVIMPAVSRFGGGKRAEKKKRVIDRLMAYYEKYLELVSGIEN